MNKENTQQNSFEPTRGARHHRRSFWFPLIIITVGVVLLLQNLGLTSPLIWSELFKFWPIIIILAGLEMVLGHSWLSQFILALTTLAILAAILFSLGLLPEGLLHQILPPQGLV